MLLSHDLAILKSEAVYILQGKFTAFINFITVVPIANNTYNHHVLKLRLPPPPVTLTT